MKSFTFAWLDSSNEALLKALRIPRDAYTELADDPQPWAALRAQFAGQLFVDVNRLLVTAGA